jgi:hypothetical protein
MPSDCILLVPAYFVVCCGENEGRAYQRVHEFIVARNCDVLFSPEMEI